MKANSDEGRTVTVLYRNHRGEARERRIQPLELRFGSNQWHPEAQWLLHCTDVERGGAERTFAMSQILRWGPAP